MHGNKALKAGVGYTIGNMLVKGINFLVLPIFSRLLTTEEFGVYNLFLSYDAILSVLIGCALHTSVKSAHYEIKKTDEYVSSISLIYMLNSLLAFILILIGGRSLAKLMKFELPVLMLIIPFSFGGAILHLYNERISLDFAYKEYLMVAVVNSVGNVVVSLILIITVFRSRRDVGRIVGTVVVLFVLAVVLICKMYRRAKPRFNKMMWKFGLLYSLPIVPHGISQVLLAQCDRIMITNIINESSAGIYSLVGNVKLALTVITTSIAVSWSTWFYSQMDKKKSKEIQKNAELLVRLFSVFTIGMMTIAPEIILIIGGREYMSGKYVAIPMIVDAFILFIYNIVVPSEYYTKKTKYIMLGTLIAAAINVLTNYIFISRFGYIAAAYTTLVSYALYLGMHLFISHRLVHFNVIRIKKLMFHISLVIGVGVFDLFFIDNVVFRVLMGGLIVILMCPPLLSYLKTTRGKDKNEQTDKTA